MAFDCLFSCFNRSYAQIQPLPLSAESSASQSSAPAPVPIADAKEWIPTQPFFSEEQYRAFARVFREAINQVLIAEKPFVGKPKAVVKMPNLNKDEDSVNFFKKYKLPDSRTLNDIMKALEQERESQDPKLKAVNAVYRAFTHRKEILAILGSRIVREFANRYYESVNRRIVINEVYTYLMRTIPTGYADLPITKNDTQIDVRGPYDSFNDTWTGAIIEITEYPIMRTKLKSIMPRETSLLPYEGILLTTATKVVLFAIDNHQGPFYASLPLGSASDSVFYRTGRTKPIGNNLCVGASLGKLQLNDFTKFIIKVEEGAAKRKEQYLAGLLGLSVDLVNIVAMYAPCQNIADAPELDFED